MRRAGSCMGECVDCKTFRPFLRCSGRVAAICRSVLGGRRTETIPGTVCVFQKTTCRCPFIGGQFFPAGIRRRRDKIVGSDGGLPSHCVKRETSSHEKCIRAEEESP